MDGRQPSGRPNFSDGKSEPVTAFQIQDPSGHIEVRTGRTITRIWKKRSCLEKTLIILLILFILIIIILSILVATKDKTEEKDAYCMTKECIVSASALIESLDLTKDPCENFYEFACGGFEKKNPIKEGNSAEDHFSKLTEILEWQLLEIMDLPVNESQDLKAISKMKIMYEVCQNKDEITKSLETNLNKLYAVFGGYPLLDSEWKEDTVSLEEIIATAIRMNLDNAMISMAIEEDLYNTSIYRLLIGQAGGIGELRKSFRRQKRESEDVFTNVFITDLNRVLGQSSLMLNTSSSEDLKAMVDIVKELKKHKTPREIRRNFTAIFNKMTIAELSTLTEKTFDWLKLINTLFEGHVVFTESEEIIIMDLDYITNLKNVLNTFSKRDIINYIISAAVIELADFVDVLDLDEDDTRWKSCLKFAETLFGFALVRLYVDHFNLTDSKAEAVEMVEDIRIEMKEMVKRTPWMDEETKDLVEEKILAISKKVAFPDWILNDTRLEDYYAKVNITDDHFENIVALLIHNGQKVMSKYGTLSDRENSDFQPLEVNAFYLPSENSIQLPIAILQKPLFVSGRLAALNFGAIGSIIGHEFFHSLDDTGRQFDKFGNLKQWWHNDMIEIFDNKTNCMIDQYSQYCPLNTKIDKKTCVDGKLTLGENIADNNGVKATYKAYQRWVRHHQPENKLPGLENFTPEQLFFLSFSHVWCETVDIEYLTTEYLTDEHSPAKYRVLGTLANLKEFSDVFQCEEGPMNKAEESCRMFGA